MASFWTRPDNKIDCADEDQHSFIRPNLKFYFRAFKVQMKLSSSKSLGASHITSTVQSSDIFMRQ
jgi:hypothetical protein